MPCSKLFLLVYTSPSPFSLLLFTRVWDKKLTSLCMSLFYLKPMKFRLHSEVKQEDKKHVSVTIINLMKKWLHILSPDTDILQQWMLKVYLFFFLA